MIKILSNPNPAKEEVAVCGNCDCEFSFVEADTRLSFDISGEHHVKFVICPNCGKELILERE